MFINENDRGAPLPLYEVRELSMEEALLVLVAGRERVSDAASNPGNGSDAMGGIGHAPRHAAA